MIDFLLRLVVIFKKIKCFSTKGSDMYNKIMNYNNNNNLKKLKLLWQKNEEIINK